MRESEIDVRDRSSRSRAEEFDEDEAPPPTLAAWLSERESEITRVRSALDAIVSTRDEGRRGGVGRTVECFLFVDATRDALERGTTRFVPFLHDDELLEKQIV